MVTLIGVSGCVLWGRTRRRSLQRRKPRHETLLFTCMDDVLQEPPCGELLLYHSLLRVGCTQRKATRPPTITHDVALQIQSVALESHHAHLVSTRFAHPT